jgi:MFS family permease
VKWLLAALLILPQSLLLGATFPLLSAGAIRRVPQSSGRVLALLYFTNSLGAAVGVLAAGFWLAAAYGCPARCSPPPRSTSWPRCSPGSRRA